MMQLDILRRLDRPAVPAFPVYEGHSLCSVRRPGSSKAAAPESCASLLDAKSKSCVWIRCKSSTAESLKMIIIIILCCILAAH